MTETLGYEGKLYANEGTYAVPDWTELTCVRDVALDTERSEHDATTRATGGFEAASAGLVKAPLNVEVLYLPEDAEYLLLWEAYRDRTKLDMLCLDRAYDAEDATGLRATFTVLKFSQPQPLDGLMICSLTLKPAYSANVPVWWPVAV